MCAISYLTPKVARPPPRTDVWWTVLETAFVCRWLALSGFLSPPRNYAKPNERTVGKDRLTCAEQLSSPGLGTSWRLGKVCRRLVLSRPLPWLVSLGVPFLN